MTETAGIRTTYGSKLFEDFVPNEDATVVKRFRQAGAVIMGKTNTPEGTLGMRSLGLPEIRGTWSVALVAQPGEVPLLSRRE